MNRTTTRLVRWMSRWGFATLVGIGGICASFVAWRVSVPDEVPTFALQAAAVYRIEVGAAVFAAVYLAAMALGLALNNRAFSEIGMGGVRAENLGGSSRAIREQDRELLALSQKVAMLRSKAERDAAQADTITPDDK